MQQNWHTEDLIKTADMVLHCNLDWCIHRESLDITGMHDKELAAYSSNTPIHDYKAEVTCASTSLMPVKRLNRTTYNRLHHGFIEFKGGSNAKVKQWGILDRAHRGCQTLPHILQSGLHITCSSLSCTSMPVSTWLSTAGGGLKSCRGERGEGGGGRGEGEFLDIQVKGPKFSLLHCDVTTVMRKEKAGTVCYLNAISLAHYCSAQHDAVNNQVACVL